MISRTRVSALTLAAILGVVTIAALPLAAQDGDMGMGNGPGMMPAFDTLDSDKDGSITPAELAAYRQTMVAGTDANADGKLSPEELAAQDMRQMTARASDRAARMVLMLDVDGDGLLSVDELAAGPGPAQMFDRMDADGDGALSRAEATQDRMRGHRDGRGPGGRHGGKGHHGFHDDAMTVGEESN
jgi:Ca2+-binding EF-hand superfamily protein